MLVVLSLLACKDPAATQGKAVEVGADDPVWDPQSLPIYKLTLPSDWEAQLTAAIPTDECADRASILGQLDYANPQSGKSEHYTDVGVRYRGHSALSEGQRFGFKLLFDAPDPDARFHDEKHINLLGTEGDFSLLHERLALGLMDSMGVPAGKVIHSRVYVNDAFLGIFPVSQEPDDQAFVDDHFEKEGGHLYKVAGYCGGSGDFEYKSADAGDYDEKYVAKAGTLPEDATSDLIPLLQCAAGNDAALQTCLPTHIDVEEWLTEMAVDAVLPDIDGLAGAGQNFMLYHDPVTSTFVVYPYDKDQSFYTSSLESDSIFDFHPPWAEPSTLSLRMRELWKADYCARVDETVDAYAKIPAKVDDLIEFLRPYMATDPYIDPHSWEAQAADIKAIVPSHGAEVRDQAEACAP